MDGHLSLLALECCRTGEGEPAEQAHLEGCDVCRGELGRLQGMAARLAPRPMAVPAAVDAGVLALMRRSRMRVVRWVSAVAALLLAAIGISHLWPAPVAPGDVDRSGRVDILDAYHLALRVRDGKAEKRFDLDGDGRVDQGDIDAIAREAVRRKS